MNNRYIYTSKGELILLRTPEIKKDIEVETENNYTNNKNNIASEEESKKRRNADELQQQLNLINIINLSVLNN